MPWRTSIGSGDLARRKGLESRDRSGSICDPDDSAIIFADSGILGWPLSAPSPIDQMRPLQVLASLLAPFAGEHAARAADALLQRFGSIDRVLSASEAQLVRTCGSSNQIGQMIVGARTLVEASLRERVLRSHVCTGDPAFQKYLILKFRNHTFEELHAIYLNADDCFLREELVAKGNGQSVECRAQPVFRRAIELGAASIILVHNHPSGHSEPSQDDIEATDQFVLAANIIGLRIVDHLIVAGNTMISLRKRGYM